MTSDRAYRRQRRAAEAIGEIRRCAGAQFDPRVAEAFCRAFERDFATLFDDMQAAFARQDPVADISL
jgi:HD-GYP domain-containing protein (c-di-GMP phosphodiesterase class II)